MILVDFSHLSARLLHVSVDKAKKGGMLTRFTEDKKIHADSYKGFYLHLLFTNLGKIKKEYEDKFGEVVICLDSSPYWRKRILSTYKSKRKDKRDESDIDYSSFYELVNETLGAIDIGFPFRVVKVETAEADDVIAVLTKEYHKKEKILIVSEDKDYVQLLRYPNVSFYRPIQEKFEKKTSEEITLYRAYHNVLGDAGDEVPTIKTNTEFSLNFIKYLRENEIHETSVLNFNKLSISKKLYEDYDVVDKKGNLDIFKPAVFGEVKAMAFAKDLRRNLKEKKIYYENYKRNRALVSLMRIPKDIREKVLLSYTEASVHYNPMKIMRFFGENRLKQLSTDIQMFYTKNNEVKSAPGMFDSWS